MSTEIEYIITQAVKIAKEKSHEYVLTEHLLLSLLRYKPFRKAVEHFGADIDMLDSEVEIYLNNLSSIVKNDPNLQPGRTQTLERLFNRANVQAMFTGRHVITTIDLFLSIMSEVNSHAHYFLLKYGLKKAEFVAFMQKHHVQSESKIIK